MEARFAAPPPGPQALELPAFAGLKRSMLYETGGRLYHVVTLFSSASIWRPEGRAVFDTAARLRLGADVQF